MVTDPPPTSPRRGSPVPVGERRGRRHDRRSGPRDRRSRGGDRRSSRTAARAAVHERRVPGRDRRSGRRDRRFAADRRTSAPRAAGAEPLVDPTIALWTVNVLCWAAIVTVALVWGMS